MSASLLEEYKAYYEIRAERYANNPNYKHSYEAEKKLSEAMQSCNELIEFKEKIGDLNEKCANALIRDKYLMRKAFYEEFQETVRVKAVNRILEKEPDMATTIDIASMINEEENKGSIEISMDEANRELIHAWKLLDDIEVYENAEVPSEYKSDMKETVNECKESLNKSVEQLEENNSHWEQGWKLKPDVVLEARHIRLLPYSEEHIKEQLQKYKSIINR